MSSDARAPEPFDETLRQSEARHRALLAAIPDLLVRLRADGTVLDYLPAKTPGPHTPADEFVGRRLQDVLPPEVVESGAACLAEALRTGEIQTIEYRLPRFEGFRDYEARLVPSGPDEALALVRDITDQKSVRRRLLYLADRSTRLQRATAALAEAVTAADVADAVVAQGPAALGARAGALLVLSDDGTTLRALRWLGYSPEDAERWERSDLGQAEPLAQAVRTAEPVWLSSREEMAERFPPALHGLPSADDAAWAVLPLVAEGRVRGILGLGYAEPRTFSDDDRGFALALARLCAQALERAWLYEAERRARAEAEAAVRARDHFLSIASHELRTPVTSLKGTCQVLERQLHRGELDAALLERYVGRISESTERLIRLVDDLLDVSRLRAGQMPLRLQPVDLDRLVREAVGRLEGAAEPGRVVVAGGDHTVVADPDRVDQVLANLLANALKYSPDGGQVRVELRMDGIGVRATVRDRGIGLPEGAEEVIFEPFGRAANARQRNLPGMGLGLYICRHIAEAHGGRLWAESAGEGQGTAFHLWLPGPASGAPSRSEHG